MYSSAINLQNPEQFSILYLLSPAFPRSGAPYTHPGGAISFTSNRTARLPQNLQTSCLIHHQLFDFSVAMTSLLCVPFYALLIGKVIFTMHAVKHCKTLLIFFSVILPNLSHVLFLVLQL